jgi:hypothetical protein
MMEAGRELDALVAERVMGFEIREHKRIQKGSIKKRGRYPVYEIKELWAGNRTLMFYSTDIAAAWRVEERIAELGLIDEYCWEIIKISSTKKGYPPTQWYQIHASPEDRCRAALRAVESE